MLLMVLSSGCFEMQRTVAFSSAIRYSPIGPVRLEVTGSTAGIESPQSLDDSLKAALRRDFASNGPLVIDDRASAVLRLRYKLDLESDPGHTVLCAVTLYAFNLFGMPSFCRYTNLELRGELVDAAGRLITAAVHSSRERPCQGFYYGHGPRSWEGLVRGVSEGVRWRLSLQGALIAQRLQAIPASFASAPATPSLVAAAPQPVPPTHTTPPTATAAVRPLPPPLREEAAAPRGGPTTGFVQGAPQAHAFALIVGVERYRDVPAVPGARRDAEQFAQLARSTLGIPARNIRVLLDDRAAKGDIESELDWLKANVGPAGRVYFFFSGHGAPEPSSSKAYLVPHGGNPANIRRTGLAMDEVLVALADTKAREVFAFVDSCFSGAGGRSVLPPGARPLLLRPSAVGGGTPRIALFTSSGASEISGPDSEGNTGLFTKHLLDALGRGKADIDGDGQVSARELEVWITPRVTAEAKRLERNQTPTLVVGTGLSRAEELIVAHGVVSQ